MRVCVCVRAFLRSLLRHSTWWFIVTWFGVIGLGYPNTCVYMQVCIYTYKYVCLVSMSWWLSIVWARYHVLIEMPFLCVHSRPLSSWPTGFSRSARSSTCKTREYRCWLLSSVTWSRTPWKRNWMGHPTQPVSISPPHTLCTISLALFNGQCFFTTVKYVYKTHPSAWCSRDYLYIHVCMYVQCG